MRTIALVFSLFMAALGVVGLVAPSWVLRAETYFQTPPGLYVAVALRLGMGVAFFFAAPASRAPGVLRMLGVVIIVAGIITLFVRRERFRGLLDWWSTQGPVFVRVWAAFALLFGAVLAYALVP